MRKMMTVLVVVAGLILFSFSAEAQVSFGVKGGVAYTTFDNPFPESSPGVGFRTVDYAQRFTGGVFMNFSLPLLPLSVQPELLYVGKGAESKWENSPVTESTTLQYLEIPILAKFTIPVPISVTPHIFAGPTYSYLVDSWHTVPDAGGGASIEHEPAFEKNDFGLTFGAGVDFNAVITKVTLDARYTLGMTNINKNEVDANRSIKNRAWVVMLGVAF